jgi:hypothetical protein
MLYFNNRHDCSLLAGLALVILVMLGVLGYMMYTQPLAREVILKSMGIIGLGLGGFFLCREVIWQISEAARRYEEKHEL